MSNQDKCDKLRVVEILILLATAVIVGWQSFETMRTVDELVKQNISEARPVLTIELSGGLMEYENIGKGPALNIIQLLGAPTSTVGLVYISNGSYRGRPLYRELGVGERFPKVEEKIKQKMVDDYKEGKGIVQPGNNLSDLDKGELLKQYSQLSERLGEIEIKNKPFSVLIYEDIFKNCYMTVHFSETETLQPMENLDCGKRN